MRKSHNWLMFRASNPRTKDYNPRPTTHPERIPKPPQVRYPRSQLQAVTKDETNTRTKARRPLIQAQEQEREVQAQQEEPLQAQEKDEEVQPQQDEAVSVITQRSNRKY